MSMNRRRCGTPVVLPVLLLNALPLLGGCGAGDRDELPPDPQVLIEDGRYMAAVFEAKTAAGWTSSIDIDLRDERQYRFVRNRLLSQGSTSENSPHLFELLESARTAPPRARGEGDGIEDVASAASAISAQWCTHFLLAEERVGNTDTHLKARALASCFDGAAHMYEDISIQTTDFPDELSFKVLGTAAKEEYGGGRSFEVTTKDNDPLEPGVALGWVDDPQRLVVIDSLAIATDSTGFQQYSYALVKTVAASPTPLPSKMTAVVPIEVQHPVDRAPPFGITRTCLERGSIQDNTDCDYITASKGNGMIIPLKYPYTGIAGIDWIKTVQAGGDWTADTNAFWAATPKYDASRRYLPVRGKFNLYHPDNACTITSYDTATTQARLVLKVSGGTCFGGIPGANVGVGLASAFSAPGAVTSTFDMLAEFGDDCVDYWSAITKPLDLYIIVRAKSKDPASKACGDRYTSVKVGPVDFRNSCFAEGTQVRRADGALVPVEQFKAGDKVIANASGLVLTVTTVARGGESRPLVNLFDTEGNDLLLTEKHPVVTAARGVLPADQVAEGDQVLTERGVTTVVSAARVTYKGQVFNLSLGTPEELAAAGKENRTMFADGYLVGDNEMQWEMESAPDAASSSPPAVEAVWRRDYEHDQSRRAASAR